MESIKTGNVQDTATVPSTWHTRQNETLPPSRANFSYTVTVSMPRTLLTIPLFPANLQSKKLGSPVVSRWLCAPRPRGARYPSFLGSLSSLGAAHGPKWELVTQRITWFSQTRGACVPRSSGTSHPIPELCSSANL